MLDDDDLPQERPCPPRKPDCVNYPECLALAAADDRHDMGCSVCNRYQGRPLDLSDLGDYWPGCAQLIFALFVDANGLGRVPTETLNAIIFGPRPWASVEDRLAGL